MNKKVLTLMAGAMLASSVGTIAAQGVVGYTKSAAPTAKTIETVTDGRAYQLSNGYEVLVMKKEVKDGDISYHLEYVPYYEANVGESLWYIDQVKSNNENGIAFQFVNLAYNLPISYDSNKLPVYKNGTTITKVANLGGKAIDWKWMRSAEGPNLTIARTPEAYITTDSVMTLIPLADKKVAAVKYATKDVSEQVSMFRIRPYVAGGVWLNKYDLNTLLQTQENSTNKFQFKFDKGTTNENLWDQTPYEAIDPVGKNTLSYGEVADAKADADAAYKVYLEKVEELQKALDDLKEQDAEVASTAAELKAEQEKYNKLVKQLLEAQVNLRSEQENKETYDNFLTAVNDAILNNSTATEETKKELLALAEQLGVAKKNYEDAAIKYNELDQAYWEANNDLMAKTEDWATANTVANAAYAEWKLAHTLDDVFTYSNQYGELKNITWGLFKTAYEPNKASWEEFFAVVEKQQDGELSQSDKMLLIEYANELYAKKYVDDDNTPISSVTFYLNSDYKTYLNGIDEALEKANEEVTKTEEAKNEAQQKVNELAEAAQDALEERDNLGKIKDDLKVQYDSRYNDLQLSEGLAVDLVERKAEYEKKLAEIESKISDLENQESNLKDATVASITRQLDLTEKLEFDKNDLAYYWRQWAKADNVAAESARDYQRLYAIYANLNTVKTPYWLSLRSEKMEDGVNTYMMVDTAYVTNNAGDQNLAFAVRKHQKDFEDVNNPMNARDINGRFNFRFFYYPTEDSMRIEADGFNRKAVTTKYWKDRTDNEIDLRSSYVPGWEQNLVKVDVLGNLREVTVGNTENIKGTSIWTINDRIGLNLVRPEYPEFTAGLYYLDVNASSATNPRNNARLMADLDGSLTLVTPADTAKMLFAHIPAAKWVAETSTDFGVYLNIKNLETGEVLNDSDYKVRYEGDTLHVTVPVVWDGRLVSEDFCLTAAPSSKEGYYSKKPDARELFTLNYLNVSGNLNVTVGNSAMGNDTILAVTPDESVKFELERVGVENYATYGSDKLERGVYKIRVNDPNKLALKHKYVQVSMLGGTEMMVVSDEAFATNFFLKEINHADGTHYYALIEALTNRVGDKVSYEVGDKKAGVVDGTGLIKAENIKAETRTSAFALFADTTRYYREFTKEELGKQNNLKFYRTSSTDKEYLYASENAELNLLAVENKGDNAGAKAEMTVIPTTEAGVLMPQYLIARNVVEQEGSVDWCGEDHTSLEDSLACEHTKVTPDTLKGEFLVNLKIDKKFNKYNWENKYTRVAFLKGYAVKEEGTMPGTGVYSKLYVDGKEFALAENKHSAVKFEFRLINEGAEQDFLIESESWKDGMPFAGETRPLTEGGWLKVQNGVPCIVADDFEAASQADVYNVDTNYDPTANEEIATSSVVVAGTNGAVVVKGAEGKNVIVSTILGKVVANEVVSSDNATIAAPQGVVVVSVDGESFKVVVK